MLTRLVKKWRRFIGRCPDCGSSIYYHIDKDARFFHFCRKCERFINAS